MTHIFNTHARLLHLVKTAFILFSISFIIPLQAGTAAIERGESEDTGLKYWIYQKDGFYLKLNQRLPDQTRAYFEARGFDQPSAEIAGTSCLFQTMIKNTGDIPGSFIKADLSEWKVVSNGNTTSMQLRDYWKKLWLEKKQPQSARIAFKWSLLPGNIDYDINDFNWGMTSYGLPPGTRFDLHFTWSRDGKSYSGVISDVKCPDDLHPDPPSEQH